MPNTADAEARREFGGAEYLIGADHQPVHHRRLVGKDVAVEVRDDVVAALEHFFGRLREDGLVDVPQMGPAQVDKKHQPGDGR